MRIHHVLRIILAERLINGGAMVCPHDVRHISWISAFRDLMLAAVEHRFRLVDCLRVTIEGLTDTGSC